VVRFEFFSDLRSDLLRLRERLAKVDVSVVDRRDIPAPFPSAYDNAPFWQRVRRFLGAWMQTGRPHARVEALSSEVSRLRAEIGDGLQRLGSMEQEIIASRAQSTMSVKNLARIEHDLARERRIRLSAITELERQHRLMRPPGEIETLAPSGHAPEPAGSRSASETFYAMLEDRYRGSREEIRQRLLVYRNDLRAARERAGVRGPVFDLGCGRGELLDMLRDDNFQAIGIDSNPTQLEEARRHGAAVVQQDALAFLREVEAGAALAVTGMHIVEHIPFNDLIALMQEVARVLRPGGVAIFETPNPRNLIVSATTFHLDPTHIRPLASRGHGALAGSRWLFLRRAAPVRTRRIRSLMRWKRPGWIRISPRSSTARRIMPSSA